MIMPVISLWMPWAEWVILEWKRIETRKHYRFASLVGKRVAIHAALKWDEQALEVGGANSARPWLSEYQLNKTQTLFESRKRMGGNVLGTVEVHRIQPLDETHSEAALIDCSPFQKRVGLFLDDVQVLHPMPMKGKQGIWYADIPVEG